MGLLKRLDSRDGELIFLSSMISGLAAILISSREVGLRETNFFEFLLTKVGLNIRKLSIGWEPIPSIVRLIDLGIEVAIAIFIAFFAAYLVLEGIPSLINKIRNSF